MPIVVLFAVDFCRAVVMKSPETSENLRTICAHLDGLRWIEIDRGGLTGPEMVEDLEQILI